MNDKFDIELSKLAEKETMELPEDYDKYIAGVLEDLPKRRRRRMTWRGAVVLAAALTAALSITVPAAVSYVRQRMEGLQEEEKRNYYAEAHYMMPADAYSRELTEDEKARMEKLKEAYINEGVFPEGELVRIYDSSEYIGTGIAFMASRSTFFLPEETVSDEELLQIIDFCAKREYSLQEAADKIQAQDTEALSSVLPPEEKAVDLKAGDMEVVFNSNLQVYNAAASIDTVYLGNASQLFQIDEGTGSLSQMEVQVPEGMEFSIMTTDEQGSLCILLTKQNLDFAVPGPLQLWKIAPDGNVLNQLDLTELGTEKKVIPQALAVDSRGNYYVSAMQTGESRKSIYVLDQNGNLLSTIDRQDKYDDIRALGRGRDGNVYGVMMKGSDWIPCLVTFDAEKGSFAEEYQDILPRDTGAYMRISAGTDTDFLIWGGEGVYSYDLGAGKAQRIAPQYDLPDSAVLSFLPDGRAVFVSDEINTEESSSDTIVARTKMIYLIRVD